MRFHLMLFYGKSVIPFWDQIFDTYEEAEKIGLAHEIWNHGVQATIITYNQES